MKAALAETILVKRNDVSVKIDAEVARLAKIVAAFEDKSLAEYISDALRPIVERDVQTHSARYGKGQDNPDPRRPKGKS